MLKAGLICFKPAFLTALLLIGLTTVNAQVWQWSALVKSSKENPGAAKAYLWIPEDCKKVRGVIVAQNNMEEISILESPLFRTEMAKLGFAEIWVSPSFDHLFRFNDGAGDTFNQMLADLANISGYHELKFAPVIPIGHSAAASWPYYFTAWAPARALAAISVSGQWPYFRSPVFAPDIWGDKNIDFVPCLETMGEYEAANTWCLEGLKERQQHPLMPLSMLACPAEGHFAATDKKIRYIAMYIKKAAQYRLTNKVRGDSTVILNQIDPLKSGWLVDRWRLNQKPAAAAAPVNKYTGNKAEAFWFFDAEMASVTEKYETRYQNQKAQLLGFVQDGKVVKQKNSHLQVDLKFMPMADGVTFKLGTAFLDTVPGESLRPADWTGLKAGSPIEHATANAPITINRVTGPFKKLDDSTFAVEFSRGFISNSQYELVFTANHQGDAFYKPAVQQAHMYIPAENKDGDDQSISFPQIKNQPSNIKSIKLNATSSSGLKVRYYIEEGPAIVADNVLTLTKIPPLSHYPVKITVVAWQYGRISHPKIKIAKPITIFFYIFKSE